MAKILAVASKLRLFIRTLNFNFFRFTGLVAENPMKTLLSRLRVGYARLVVAALKYHSVYPHIYLLYTIIFKSVSAKNSQMPSILAHHTLR